MRVMAKDVVEFVAKRHGLRTELMYSPQRYRDVARPRQIAMYAIRQLCPHLSFPEIGRRLGGRDHTTIMHGVRRIESLIRTDQDIAESARETLAFFRGNDEPETPIAAAIQFQALCRQYGHAMRAAA